MKRLLLFVIISIAVTACSDNAEQPTGENPGTNSVSDSKQENDNPFFSPWDTPFGIPPFSQIEDHHYSPAFQSAIKAMLEELEVVRTNKEPPTFENTIRAYEFAGKEVDRVIRVFASIAATDSNDKINALQIEFYPELTRVRDSVLLDETLFSRVSAVFDMRDELELDVHDRRLLELTHRDFILAGAGLDLDEKARLKEINAQISEKTTQFSQNLLAETKDFELDISDEADLTGLTPDLISAAAVKAENEGKEGHWLFGLDRATYEGFMTFSENRALRKVMFDAYRARGSNNNEKDNNEILLEIARLRAERAAVLGYKSHAHYQLETRMAKTPENVVEFLVRVWESGLRKTAKEKAEMQQIIDSEGHDFELAGHDWWHYAEKLRGKKFAFDESQLKPYFEVNNVLEGAFHVAEELFGLKFSELIGAPRWHPKVQVYEVTTQDNQHLGVFSIDFYARDSKRGGAWMSAFRAGGNSQQSDDERHERPLVNNNLNFAVPPEGSPTLLSFGQVTTLFHEFGHALHGLMTTARYDRYAGTNGAPRDFVEFPAQFLEHYALAPEVLSQYAKHYQTGEVISQELIEKLQTAATHNQGFKTTEYIAASLLDIAWHLLDVDALNDITSVDEFERDILGGYGLPNEIGPRYKSTYFAHIFSSPDGYSAGYYAYLWSEILDADGFFAFQEAGNIYDPELSARLADHVYEAGALAPSDELYRRFRLAEPVIEPLLKVRGLE